MDGSTPSPGIGLAFPPPSPEAESAEIRAPEAGNEEAGARPASSMQRMRRASALRGGDVVACGVAGVDLARAADLGFRILLLLQPVRHPARGTRDREHHREH